MPPSSEPGRTRHFSGLNHDTIYPGDPGLWRNFFVQQPLPASEAYAKALAAHRAWGGSAESGFRLYAVDHALECSVDIPAERGRHVIVGRHTRCDLVLPEDASVSLRHVLVRASALDDGMPVLTVLDLDTPSGFELSDGSQQRSIVATGAVVFRVGCHSLVALPCGRFLPDRLEAPQVARVEASAYQVIARPVDSRWGRITIVPHSTQIAAYRSPALRAVPSNAHAYAIALESGGRRAAVTVTDRDVEHGILIGRAPRCVDAGLRQLLNGGISRVHVLLIRERDGVFLYDVASTNGTYLNEQRVRCVALNDHGTRVNLWGHVPLCLTWHALSSA